MSRIDDRRQAESVALMALAGLGRDALVTPPVWRWTRPGQPSKKPAVRLGTAGA